MNMNTEPTLENPPADNSAARHREIFAVESAEKSFPANKIETGEARNEISEMPEDAHFLNNTADETPDNEPEEREIFPEISARELAENRWSVISADDCAAISLKYEEAKNLIKKLHRAGISGLCLVTDETAGRMLRNLIQNF